MKLPLEGLTMALNSGAMVVDDGATTYDIGTAVNFALDGAAYLKATVSNGTTPVLDGTTGAAFVPVLPDQACVLVFALDAAGAVSLHQADSVTVDADSDVLDVAAQLPLIDLNTYCPIAYVLYQTAGNSAAAGLKPGTDNWNATGLTSTVVNLIVYPSRPVAA